VPGGGANLTAGASYTVCAVLKGDVGGEIVTIGVGPGAPSPTKTLTTTAANYCVTGVPAPTQLNRTFQLRSSLNQTIYLYGVCTTTQSVCLPPSIPTTASQITALQGITWSPTLCQSNGTNCPVSSTIGNVTLVAGTATATTSAACTVSGTCTYQLTNCGVGGTQGMLSLGTITAGTSFVINSSSNTDTSKVCWTILP